MESPYILTTFNAFTEINPCVRHAVRLSVGFSREDQRYTLLCIYRAKGAILAELALTEDERLDLIQRLVEAAPLPNWPEGGSAEGNPSTEEG